MEKASEEGYLQIRPLIYIPIDTRPVIKERLDKWELDWLNEYNGICRQQLENMLEGADLDYLIKQTKEL